MLSIHKLEFYQDQLILKSKWKVTVSWTDLGCPTDKRCRLIQLLIWAMTIQRKLLIGNCWKHNNSTIDMPFQKVLTGIKKMPDDWKKPTPSCCMWAQSSLSCKKNPKTKTTFPQRTRIQSLGFNFVQRIWTPSNFWADWAVVLLLSLLCIT